MFDVVKGANGHRRFMLGPVEMSIVAAIPFLLLSMMAWNWNRAMDAITQQGTASIAVTNQLAGVREQLRFMGAQLDALSGLPQRLSRAEVQLERDRQDIEELRHMRGLK
jgi:hypothetical protein